MPADLTAKKRSDMRITRIRGAVAPSTAPAVGPMSGPAAVHAQAEQLKARLVGFDDRLPGSAVESDAPVLADVVALFDRSAGMPELPVDGTTTLLDGKGRFSCAEARTLLGWAPQDLRAHAEGRWVVLRPTGSLSTSRCTPRLNGSDKITLPTAQRRLLRVEPGRRVYVQPIPHADAIALLNPAAVLLGAPLSLLAAA